MTSFELTALIVSAFLLFGTTIYGLGINGERAYNLCIDNGHSHSTCMEATK